MQTEAGLSPRFMVLGTVFVTCLTLSNLLAGKLIAVGGLCLQAVDLVFPVIYILGDVITEVYGFRKMRFLIWLGFACNLLVAALCALAVALPAHPDFTYQESFATVFSIAPRIFLASIAAYLCGEFSNAALMVRIKTWTQGRWLWLRTIGSSVIGDGLDTAVFSMIAFVGVIPLRTLLGLMLFQYGWKLGYEVLLTPVTCWMITGLSTSARTGIERINQS